MGINFRFFNQVAETRGLVFIFCELQSLLFCHSRFRGDDKESKARYNKIMQYITKSVQETKDLAKKIIKDLIGRKISGALVLALKGDLGAGKTTFIQGLAEELGIKERILSPTFVIMKRFQLDNPKFENLYHFDCYRIDDILELEDFGFNEIIKNSKNLVVIEWPENIKSALPMDAIWVEMEHGENEGERTLELKN